MTDEHGKEVNEALPGAPLRISGEEGREWREMMEYAGWKDSLPSPGDIVLEASDSNRAEKAIKWRKRIEMEEKAEKDWVRMEDEGCRTGRYYRWRRKEVEKLIERNILRWDKHYLIGDKGMTRWIIKYFWLEWTYVKIRFNSSSYCTQERTIEKEWGWWTSQIEDTCQFSFPSFHFLYSPSQLRTDVEGSLEAILEVISTYSSTRCNLQLVDFGVGPPTEKEIEMAETAGGTIVEIGIWHFQILILLNLLFIVDFTIILVHTIVIMNGECFSNVVHVQRGHSLFHSSLCFWEWSRDQTIQCCLSIGWCIERWSIESSSWRNGKSSHWRRTCTQGETWNCHGEGD